MKDGKHLSAEITKDNKYTIYYIKTDSSYIYAGFENMYDPGKVGDTANFVISTDELFKDTKIIKKYETKLDLYIDNKHGKR